MANAAGALEGVSGRVASKSFVEVYAGRLFAFKPLAAGKPARRGAALGVADQLHVTGGLLSRGLPAKCPANGFSLARPGPDDRHFPQTLPILLNRRIAPHRYYRHRYIASSA